MPETDSKGNGQTPGKDPYWVDALAQGLEVLKAFDNERPALTLSEVANKLGWSRTKPFRFLHTLEKLGYLSKDPSGRTFRLTSLSMQLGFAYLNGTPLVERAQPVLDRLRTEVSASVHMGVLEGKELIYVAQARMAQPNAININIGARLPAYATSIGRALLAYQSDAELDAIIGSEPLSSWTHNSITDPRVLRDKLASAKQQGYVFSDEEFHLGIRSIAAPIFDAQGHAVAAVNATGSTYLFTDEQIDAQIIPAVQRAAHELSQGLGYFKPTP